MTDYFQKWRQETIAYLGGHCIKCNTTEDLEFDHIDESTKLFGISAKWSIKDKVLLQAEIDKCQLLCKKHHAEKTIPYVSNYMSGITHGTFYGWTKAKCKCEICTQSKLAWYEKRNAKRRVSENGYGLRQVEAACGTYKKYKRGCRCDECKKANSSKAMEQKRMKAEQITG